MKEQKKLTNMTQGELEALFADKTMPEWFDYLTPEEEAQLLSTLDLPDDERKLQNRLDELTPPEDLQEWLAQLQSQEDTSEEEIPCFYFSNPDPYWKPEPLPPDHVPHNFWLGEADNIHVKNLSAFWLPEFTLQKEIGGTIYTVTGSYDGTETLDKKMERIMGEKFTEKQEDSE